jgi:triacylglycerol esterase/lipase EstA (alpha/beta hydrolase family)
MMIRRNALAVLTVIAVINPLAVAVAAADEPPGPQTPSWAAAFLYSVTFAPNADAPGANDWSCRPSAPHPRAVVLVHGTWENRYDNWAWMAPHLQAADYCVFALNYGDDEGSILGRQAALKGTGDIRRSAGELAAFVERVLAATGTTKVDIVAHSQGGPMARWYVRFLAGRTQVRKLITLGATNHGTTLSGLASLANLLHLTAGIEPVIGTAGIQQAKGSDFIAELNADGDTEPGISYTVIATRYDQVSTPYRDTFLTPGPGADVTNILIQTGCPLDFSDHLSMSSSPRTIGLVQNALDPAHAHAPPCRPWRPIG